MNYYLKAEKENGGKIGKKIKKISDTIHIYPIF